MNFIKNTVTTLIGYAAAGVGCIVGFRAGEKLWNEKIEPAVDKKLHKKG